MSTAQVWLFKGTTALSSFYVPSVNLSLNREFIYSLRYIHRKRYQDFEKPTEQVHLNEGRSIFSWTWTAVLYCIFLICTGVFQEKFKLCLMRCKSIGQKRTHIDRFNSTPEIHKTKNIVISGEGQNKLIKYVWFR